MQNAATPRQAVDLEREAEDTLDNDPLVEQFFSQPPPAAWEVALDDWQPRPLSRGEQRAMFATFGLLGCGALAAFAFLLFPDAWLVTPAPLRGAGVPLAALSSAQLELAAPVIAPEPAPPIVASTPVPSAAIAAAGAMSEPLANEPAVRAPARARVARNAARSPRRAAPTGLLAQARRALNAGDARRARDLATRAIALAPTQAAAYIVLAGAHDALGERASMRAAFRSCMQNAQDPLAAACKTLGQ